MKDGEEDFDDPQDSQISEDEGIEDTLEVTTEVVNKVNEVRTLDDDIAKMEEATGMDDKKKVEDEEDKVGKEQA